MMVLQGEQRSAKARPAPSPGWAHLWISVAGATLVLGGLAWISKLAVVVSTEGRVTATGAAGAFFTLGLTLILVGSTGVGLRLAMNGDPESRIFGIVFSPILFVAGFMVLQAAVAGAMGAARAVFGGFGPDYAREEAIILLTAVASLAAGYTLLRGGGPSAEGPAPEEPGARGW